MVVVGEDQGLAEQRVLQLLPGFPVEAECQSWSRVAGFELNPEQVGHVPGTEPSFDLLPRAFEGWRPSLADGALAPLLESPLQFAQALATLGDLP